MALPKLMRDIFANEGAGPLFREDKIPSVFVKVAAQTFSDAQKKQARTNIGADAIPSGTMMAFGGKSVPDGWLLCNGATVSRTTYAKLFAAIGTAWGAGDGSTTFKLPTADGRAMQGVTEATRVGQYIEAGLPNITGTGISTEYANPTNGLDGTGCVSGENGRKNPERGYYAGANYTWAWWDINASKSNVLYGSNSTVQPPAIQILIIIKI